MTNKLIYNLILSVFILFCSLSYSHAQSYLQSLDNNNSVIEMTLNSSLMRLNGSLKRFEGKILLFPNRIEDSQVDLILDLTSATTTANQPYQILLFQGLINSLDRKQLRFKSSNVKKLGESYQLIGKAIYGDTISQVSIPFKAISTTPDYSHFSGATEGDLASFSQDLPIQLRDFVSGNVQFDLKFKS